MLILEVLHLGTPHLFVFALTELRLSLAWKNPLVVDFEDIAVDLHPNLRGAGSQGERLICRHDRCRGVVAMWELK